MAFCQMLFTIAAAQQIPHFTETVTTESGLSSNNINDLVQDNEGFLWIATPEGLNRFDGTETITYYQRGNANSLPHNYVYCVKKLPGNNLAIGTQGGLSFYNSNTGLFHNFYYKQNNALDEYNNIITELETDTYGNILAASKNCIFIFDKNLQLKKTITSPFTETDAGKQRLRFVEKMYPLSNGKVLLFLYDGWHIYSGSTNIMESLSSSSMQEQFKFLNIVSPPGIDKNFTSAHLFKVFEKYFICIPADKDSLLLFNEEGKEISSCFSPYNKYPNILWSQKITVVDSTKLSFLFHYSGLAVIPVKWVNNEPVLLLPSQPLFNEHVYNNSLSDIQGNWWLATAQDGLQKVSPSKQYFTSNALIDDITKQPVKCETVSLSKYNNVMWVATYGAGFFEVDLSTGKQQQHHFYKTSDDTWSNHIWNIRKISADTMWVGTQNGMFWYNVITKKFGRIPAYPGKPEALDSVPVTTQYTDSHGLVWMGLGKGKGLCYFDNITRRFTNFPGNVPAGYPLRYPTNIAEDNSGNIWFASDGSTSLVYWNRNNNKFQTIPLPDAREKHVSNLYGIWCESDSVLWLGSITCGLIRYQVVKNEITIYSHEQGLNNSHISSIYEDSKKRLWLITEGGLSCFDQQTATFTNYTSKDGLPVKYPTDFFYYDTLNRFLYAGGEGAFFYFHPDTVTFNQYPQKTLITSIAVNGKPYVTDKDKVLNFSAQQDDITIQYAAIDLTDGPELKYAYKLIGKDTGWIMAGHQRQINFSHLAPGNYTFMVGVANGSGVTSNQTASVNFVIHPPFTQTAWFYALILFAIGAVFYVMYRFRLKEMMRAEQIRSEISRNLHDEVGANLTNISLSSLLAQKQLQNENAVSRLLERIYQDSQKVSEAMREIVWSINPAIDTLGEALPRMLHYAAELLETKNIELKASIAPQGELVKLSMKERRDLYLIFKEAVNNMAKHSKAAHAFISFQLKDTTLVLVIEDDGTGFDVMQPHINNGLKNMQERAQRNKWKLQLNSKTGTGTSITLFAPIA